MSDAYEWIRADGDPAAKPATTVTFAMAIASAASSRLCCWAMPEAASGRPSSTFHHPRP